MKILLVLPILLALSALPIHSTAADPPTRRPSPALASLAPTAAAGPLRILLVDDDLSENNHNPGDSRLVQGASLLPLIPAELVFSSPAIRAKTVGQYPYPDSYQDSEEAIRGVNAIIFRSNPSPTIKQRIKTLYNATGSPETIGMRANDLAVPPGWVAQRGLYQQVIAPYCGSRHFAHAGALSFGSWAEVLQLKQAIQRVVCTDFTMPHSEILFRKFWTQTGAVSLPGLLSTSLGFPKCR